MRCAVVLLLLSAGVASAQDGTLPLPPVLSNPPLPPEDPPAPPPEAPEHFGRRFGPMGHLAVHVVNGQLPGLGGALGFRFAVLPRLEERHLNVAVGAFFGLEAVNFVPVLGPGVRLELLGARAPVLLPYVSLSTFAQALVPTDRAPVGGRVGLAFSWNLLAAAGDGGSGWWFGWGGSGTWIDVPIAIVAAIITFGDARVFLQTNALGDVMGGFSLGAGF